MLVLFLFDWQLRTTAFIGLSDLVYKYDGVVWFTGLFYSSSSMYLVCVFVMMWFVVGQDVSTVRFRRSYNMYRHVKGAWYQLTQLLFFSGYSV